MPDRIPNRLEIRRLSPADRDDLAALFAAFSAHPATVHFFHPHPFTDEVAAELCEREGRDLYFLARVAGRPVGYSMLRGWDEGYSVPSFGVGVHPEARGQRIGHDLLSHAILESRAVGATRLRLTVLKTNTIARRIYTQFGFQFSDKDAESLLGVLELTSDAAAA